MKKKSYKKVFYRFLSSKDALMEFTRNFKDDRKMFHRQSIARYLARTKLYSLVDSAFVWDDTPEGHYFWANIDDAWRDYLKALDSETK